MATSDNHLLDSPMPYLQALVTCLEEDIKHVPQEELDTVNIQLGLVERHLFLIWEVVRAVPLERSNPLRTYDFNQLRAEVLDLAKQYKEYNERRTD